jgi:hypothetical protein
MMMCGVLWLLFWTFLSSLLFIAVLGTVIWLVMRVFRSPHMLMTLPFWHQQKSPHPPYQRGYGDPGVEPETYEEGGRAYSYPEQPSPLYQPHPPQEQQ